MSETSGSADESTDYSLTTPSGFVCDDGDTRYQTTRKLTVVRKRSVDPKVSSISHDEHVNSTMSPDKKISSGARFARLVTGASRINFLPVRSTVTRWIVQIND